MNDLTLADLKRVESVTNEEGRHGAKLLAATLADLVAVAVSEGGEKEWRCGSQSGHEDGWFCDPYVPKDQLLPDCGWRLVLRLPDEDTPE